MAGIDDDMPHCPWARSTYHRLSPKVPFGIFLSPVAGIDQARWQPVTKWRGSSIG